MSGLTRMSLFIRSKPKEIGLQSRHPKLESQPDTWADFDGGVDEDGLELIVRCFYVEKIRKSEMGNPDVTC